MSERERELLEETEFTRPVDFHSWRRRFVQALADMGMNAQQAQALAGHADLGAHERYLRTTSKTLVIPDEALPLLTVENRPWSLPKLETPNSTIQQDSWSQLRDLNSGPAVYEKLAQINRNNSNSQYFPLDSVQIAALAWHSVALENTGKLGMTGNMMVTRRLGESGQVTVTQAVVMQLERRGLR